jgi:hypothetical protein
VTAHTATPTVMVALCTVEGVDISRWMIERGQRELRYKRRQRPRPALFWTFF